MLGSLGHLGQAMLEGTSALFRHSTWREITACDILLVCGDTDRSFLFASQHYAPLLDSVGDRARQRGCVVGSVAARYSRRVGEATYGAPASYARDLVLIALRAGALRWVRGAPYARKWQTSREAWLWRDILDRARPRLVLAIQPDAALCRAARELKVDLFDVQHGVVSSTLPGSYYARDRFGAGSRSDLPSGFLCWDATSAEEVRSASVGCSIETIVVGNPWVSRFLEASRNDELVQAAVSEVPISRRTDGPVVLVSMQFNQAQYAADYVRNGYLADALVQTIQRMTADCQWLIRLHPSQQVGQEARRVERFLSRTFAAQNNVEWHAASRVALPALLARVDAHLTHYSAVTCEASVFGVPTGLLSPHFRSGGRHAGLFSSERNGGSAVTLDLLPDSIARFVLESVPRAISPLSSDGSHSSLEAFLDRKLGRIGAGRSSND